jgi:hypothetical protein
MSRVPDWITEGPGVVAILIILAVSLLVTAAMARWSWSWYSDFIAAATALIAVLTAALLGLAVLAGLIATAAYWQAIQRPKLWGHVIPSPPGTRGRFSLQVRLWNLSRFAGRNPAVRLEFAGFDGELFKPNVQLNRRGNWREVPIRDPKWVGFQWDGGADLVLYGRHGRLFFLDVPTF